VCLHSYSVLCASNTTKSTNNIWRIIAILTVYCNLCLPEVSDEINYGPRAGGPEGHNWFHLRPRAGINCNTRSILALLHTLFTHYDRNDHICTELCLLRVLINVRPVSRRQTSMPYSNCPTCQSLSSCNIIRLWAKHKPKTFNIIIIYIANLVLLNSWHLIQGASGHACSNV